jgi:exodeoxyribonuclease-3
MSTPLRIATWNVNGFRNAIRKDVGTHLETIGADVVLLQEIRSTPEQLPAEWREPEGWHVAWHPAERLGYAGTAVLSRHPITVLQRGMGEADPEGRVLVVRTGGMRLVSVYLPSGSSGEERQRIKDAWMPAFSAWAEPMLRSRVPTVLGGDFNVALDERDIYHWKGNLKNSGFLPHERAWLAGMINAGWRDLVREHFGDRDGPYTWWSNRGQARALDRGWRIDHLLANRAAGKRFRGVRIEREAGLAVSDHAPVVGEFESV